MQIALPTLQDRFDPKSNNFDVLRVLAACLVLFSHSFPMTGSSFEPVYAYFGGYDTGGGLAVNAFLVISGFLIIGAYERSTLPRFVSSRLLRVLPALAAVTLVQLLVVGPLFSSVDWKAYVQQPHIWEQLWNLTIFQMQVNLPGVFMGLPIEHVINGSLWTLPIEVAYYILLPVVVFIVSTRLKFFWVVPAACISALFILEVAGCSYHNQCGVVVDSLPVYTTTKLSVFFSVGAAAWVYRRVLTIRLEWAVAAFIILYAFAGSTDAVAKVAYYLCFSYLVIFFGTYRKIPMSWYEKKGDLSYGTYIIAWPVQQITLVVLGVGIGPYGLFFAALVPTLILAYLSWNYVEKPALSLKKTGFRPLRVRFKSL